MIHRYMVVGERPEDVAYSGEDGERAKSIARVLSSEKGELSSKDKIFLIEYEEFEGSPRAILRKTSYSGNKALNGQREVFSLPTGFLEKIMLDVDNMVKPKTSDEERAAGIEFLAENTPLLGL